MSQGTTKGVPIDTDSTFTANSDLVVPSQKAVKSAFSAWVANLVSNVTGILPIANGGTGNANGYATKNPMLIASEQYAAGAGGVSGAIGANTRHLNTVESNTISGAALASYQITGLVAGDLQSQCGRGCVPNTSDTTVYL